MLLESPPALPCPAVEVTVQFWPHRKAYTNSRGSLGCEHSIPPENAAPVLAKGNGLLPCSAMWCPPSIPGVSHEEVTTSTAHTPRPAGTDQLSRTELNCLEKEADTGNTLRSHIFRQYSK